MIGIVPAMEPAAGPKRAVFADPEWSLCKQHGYELKHYCADCEEVVCIYCTMKEHNGHSHDMLRNRKRSKPEETDVEWFPVEKKRKTQIRRSATQFYSEENDSSECMFGQMVGKMTLHCGDLVLSTISQLPDCNVSGTVVVSDHVKLTVSLKNACGSPIVKQSDKIRVSSDHWYMENLHVEEQDQGRYIISYNPIIKKDHLLSVNWREFHCKVKVVVNLRDYAGINHETKIIDSYPDAILKAPYLLAKGPDNQLIVRSNKELVIFDNHLCYSHVIGRTGMHCTSIFKAITGLAVDKNGYVYVEDCSLHRILINGMPISVIGNEGTADGQFRSPYGLLLSQSQLLFVCDLSNHRIQVLKDDKFFYCFGEQGTEPGTFNYPIDLTTNNSEDKLFITDCNRRVQVFSVQGEFLKVFDSDFTDIPYQLQNPIGIHHTPDGHLLISSYGTHCVMVFTDDGKFVSAIEGTYQGKERFSHPCGVVMMDNGQIVIAGSYNKLVVF